MSFSRRKISFNLPLIHNNKRKSIVLLSNASSPHTQKWAIHFAEKDYTVYVLSFSPAQIENVNVCILKGGIQGNIRYMTAVFQVNKLVAQIKPDIIHAHYASGYGLLGAITNFHPYIISVWGSDVFDFPQQSLVHKKILQHNLSKADYICSTSHVMANEVKKYTHKKIIITPFGIDCSKFKPINITKDSSEIVIGTVKSLEEAYGVEYLIRAFSILAKKYADMNLKLLIVGEGILRSKLERLAEELSIKHFTRFTGKVPHDLVPEYLNRLSVYVSVSVYESFGVAILEASACEIPVVVSNVGGLPEVVRDGVTGFIIPPRNPEEAAKAIEKLILNPDLRSKMGIAGREFVLRNYEWNKTAMIMEQVYENIIKTDNR